MTKETNTMTKETNTMTKKTIKGKYNYFGRSIKDF